MTKNLDGSALWSHILIFTFHVLFLKKFVPRLGPNPNPNPKTISNLQADSNSNQWIASKFQKIYMRISIYVQIWRYFKNYFDFFNPNVH